MPSSLVTRVETTLLEIADRLRTLQFNSFQPQERLIEKTDETFRKKISLAHKKLFIEGLSLVGTTAIQGLLMKKIEALPKPQQPPTDATSVQIEQYKEDVENYKEEVKNLQSRHNLATEFFGKSLSLASSLFDPSQLSQDAELERTRTRQQEVSNLQSSLQSFSQSVDATLQRLQQTESNTKTV